MTIKLLVTDLDGTLLDAMGMVHPQDREAIARLRRQGVVVSIATGRMYSGTRHIAEELDLDVPVACVDGSHIVHPQSDEHVVQRAISAAGLKVARRALGEQRPAVFAFAGDRMVHDEAGEPLLSYVGTWTQQQQCVPDVFAHADWGSATGPLAFVAIGSRAQLVAVEEEIIARAAPLQAIVFEIQHPTFFGLWGMIIREAGVTKATAVDWLAHQHGISLDEVITVGDWLNDIPMLLSAGHSFAMGQAPDEVKRAAGTTLDADVSSGGAIVEAARRCGLL